MEYSEAKNVLIEVQRLFPNFNKDRDIETARTWIRLLQKGNYEKTMEKLDEYAIESSYPPNVADILVKEYKHRDDGMPEKIREAEERVKRELEADPGAWERRKRKLDELKRKLGENYGE